MLARATKWELIDVCMNEGLGVLPWSPLRGGLSGKFTRDMNKSPADTRIAQAEQQGWGESWSNYNNEHSWNVLDVAKRVENACIDCD
ncbi:MAG: hypothetical protein ACQEWV_11210 [Bacillota bacterium]